MEVWKNVVGTVELEEREHVEAFFDALALSENMVGASNGPVVDVTVPVDDPTQADLEAMRSLIISALLEAGLPGRARVDVETVVSAD